MHHIYKIFSRITCPRLKRTYIFLRVTMILNPSIRNSRLFGIMAVLSLYFNQSTRMSCKTVSVLELRVELHRNRSRRTFTKCT